MSAGISQGLHADLKDLWGQIDRVADDARDLAGGLSDAQFNWSPDPGRRWSVGECIAHLNVAGGLYLPIVDKAIRSGREKGFKSAGPYNHSFIGNLFVKLAEPPPKVRFKAPSSMLPPSNERRAETLDAFLQLQDRWRECLRSANGLDLGRIRVSSPINSMLKFSLGQAFALTASHERRHLWQAHQVLNHAQFPAA